MGIKNFVKNKAKELIEFEKEKAEFRREVNKEALNARREAYKKEFIKQAGKEGKKLAKPKKEKQSIQKSSNPLSIEPTIEWKF